METLVRQSELRWGGVSLVIVSSINSKNNDLIVGYLTMANNPA